MKRLMSLKSIPFLFTLLFCLHSCQLFGQDAPLTQPRKDKVTGLIIGNNGYVRPTRRPPKALNKEQLFQGLLGSAEVSINLEREFTVIDSFCINDYFFPDPSISDTNHKIQMLRTVALKSDTNYMIGIQAVTYWRSKPKKDTLLEWMIDKYADKSHPVQSLSNYELEKINADSGRGAIYDLDMSVPFKNKYDKCKVLAAENKKGEYIALYYFYHDIKNKRIMKIIESQLGMVKFR